jgi:hypothetical protein
MATNNPRGFVPSRHLNGSLSPSHNQYRVSANNPTAMFIGDAVELFSDGKVRVIDAGDESVASRAVLGVVRSVYDSNARPLTHSLPATGQFIDGSTAGYVDVCDDPDTIFLVSSDATASQADIGQFVSVTAGSANSSIGISGMHIKLAEATASAIGHRFMIVGVGPNEHAIGGLGDNVFANNQDLEVIIARHQWRTQFARIGPEVGD